MNSEAVLSQLRDIHLPEPVSWWPLAPGWWILAGLLVVCVGGNWWIVSHRRKTRLKRVALAELANIRSWNLEHGDSLQTVKQLSALLRRVCLSIESRNQCAALTGTPWLQYLDKLGNCSDFSSGSGRVLIEAPYLPQTDIPAIEMIDLCQRWLESISYNLKD